MLFRNFLVAMGALGCGASTTQTDVKMSGVGLDPDEIGIAPSYSGGLVEYNLVDFAGAQLPLGILGFSSYSELGPEGDFRPPYKLVVSKGFVFENDALGPDSTLGLLDQPPSAVGACQTRFEPRSDLSGLADVGHHIQFRTEDGLGGVNLDRSPSVWPTGVSDVRPFYSNVEAWRPQSVLRKTRVSTEDDDPSKMASLVHALANFPEGKSVEMDFPGGIPPVDLNMGSIPLPLRSQTANRSLVLPYSPKGVRLSWDGPRYDRYGLNIESGHPEFELNMTPSEQAANESLGDQAWVRTEKGYSTCLEYLPMSAMPEGVDDCLGAPAVPSTTADFDRLELEAGDGLLHGQMYTGPWETPDQQVVFEWLPGRVDTNETLTLTVRFLGPVDRADQRMGEPVVSGDEIPQASSGWSETIEESWEQSILDGNVPEGTPLPVPDREAMACDDDTTGDVASAGQSVNWTFDRRFTYEDGSTVPVLQGDPAFSLAEVTCRLDDQAGRFVLSQNLLDRAMDYAALHGGEGAVFFLTRTTETEIQGPPVRNPYGKRHDASPIKVISRSMKVGRFWYGQ